MFPHRRVFARIFVTAASTDAATRIGYVTARLTRGLRSAARANGLRRAIEAEGSNEGGRALRKTEKESRDDRTHVRRAEKRSRRTTRAAFGCGSVGGNRKAIASATIRLAARQPAK